MNLEQSVQIAELIAAVAVIISIIYLGVQVRQGTRVNSAAARHAISHFALEFSMFKAEHADRLAIVWNGYVRYVKGYLATTGVRDFWADVGSAFSLNFSEWIDGLLAAEFSGNTDAA